MSEFFKYSRIQLFAGMGLILLLLHFNIYEKKIIDLDEIVYLHLAENMGWDCTNYNTVKLFPPGHYPRAVYSSPVFHHPPLIPYMIKMVSAFGIPASKAARTINLLFLMSGIIYLYLLTEILAGRAAALLSSLLMLVCPVFLLETNLIHIDQFQAYFLLAGLYHYFHAEKNGKSQHLYVSGGFFALSMLVKFTSPVLFVFPVLLALRHFVRFRDRKSILIFLAVSSAGFVWWLYFLFRFHSLFPPEIMGDGTTMAVKPDAYYVVVSNRNWLTVWKLFAVIYPFFMLLYIVGTLYGSLILLRRWRRVSFVSAVTRHSSSLVLLNTAGLVSILLFIAGNSFGNSVWVLRYYIQIYPLIFLICAAAAVNLYRFFRSPALRSWLLTLSGLNIILILFTSWSVVLYHGLIIKPSLFILVPKLEHILR